MLSPGVLQKHLANKPVYEEGQVGRLARVRAKPFQRYPTRDSHKAVKTKNPKNIGVFEVFSSKKMVGAEGVEPSTFWSRTEY